MPTHLEQGWPFVDIWNDLIMQNVPINFSQHICGVVYVYVVIFCCVVPEKKNGNLFLRNSPAKTSVDYHSYPKREDN